MKKFLFRLQRVLEFRNLVKKEKERELARRHMELHEAQARLDQIIEAQEHALMPQQHITIAELNLIGDYRKYLQEALIKQRLLVIEATEAVEKAREAYIEKALEAETLEGVKERRQAEFKDECRKEERKSLDKLTVQRHRFKSKFQGQGME